MKIKEITKKLEHDVIILTITIKQQLTNNVINSYYIEDEKLLKEIKKDTRTKSKFYNEYIKLERTINTIRDLIIIKVNR